MIEFLEIVMLGSIIGMQFGILVILRNFAEDFRKKIGRPRKEVPDNYEIHQG